MKFFTVLGIVFYTAAMVAIGILLISVSLNILQPQDKFVTANSLKLHYLDWGNPDAPPMLLLHGLCGNAHYWDFCPWHEE